VTSTAFFRFHGDLLPLLPPDRREGYFAYPFNGRQSAKHLVEAARVPHTEVGELRIGDLTASLEVIVQHGERVDVFPCLPPAVPETAPRFILDNHLGRLAASLRMLGFDCLYRNDYQDEELSAVCATEGRILLTRDRCLLMRKAVLRGRLLRSMDSETQLSEILARYNLAALARPFTRCIRCNGWLAPVDKAEVDALLQPLTRRYFDNFSRCDVCGQIYWKGSHWERMLSKIQGK
jgi:hypothetical protein